MGKAAESAHRKKGFMKDFFDVILESSATDTSDVNKRHYSKAKTAINEGVWAGINQTDLVKFFNGCRKLPQWKASEFFQHLDKARVESLFDDISIVKILTNSFADILSFQLFMGGYTIPTIFYILGLICRAYHNSRNR